MPTDIYQTITDRIINQMEQGALKWRMPWHSSAETNAPLSLPVNLTGRTYRGCNVPLLWGTQQAFGYETAIWGTYKQWNERGAQVRKGEKATLVIFWKNFQIPKDEDELTTAGAVFARGYSVFNAAQVDNFDGKVKLKAGPPDLSESERIAAAETFFGNFSVPVQHGGNRAFYAPSRDIIQMPMFSQFRDGISYYATLGHESVHATGHETRCNRQFGRRFGDQAYAFEELCAELGAAFLCAHLGLTNEPRQDHAAYIQSWLKTLRGDKRAIFTAASKAQAAVDYLIALQPNAASPEEVDDTTDAAS